MYLWTFGAHHVVDHFDYWVSDRCPIFVGGVLQFSSQEIGIRAIPDEEQRSDEESSEFTPISDTSDFEYLMDLMNEETCDRTSLDVLKKRAHMKHRRSTQACTQERVHTSCGNLVVFVF